MNKMNNEAIPKIRNVSIWWDAVRTHIETYLLQGSVTALVVAGPPQTSVGIIASALKPHHIVPSEIDLILNTHGHIDHIGGNGLVKTAGKALPMIHRDDAVFIEDRGRSFDLFYAPGRENIEERKTAFLAQMCPAQSLTAISRTWTSSISPVAWHSA
jgi:glyoxylase-like metal-dependent hydrolase (beta-lactamase superfamily II)